MNDKTVAVGLTPKDLMDVFIRLGLVVLLVVLCFRVFSPFLGLMLWALVLAVTLYPIHQGLANRMGGRQGRAATVFVLSGLILIGAPVVMLSTSAAENVSSLYQAYENGSLVVPPPRSQVAEWPLVGERLYAAWEAAAANLTEFVQDNRPALKAAAAKVFGIASSTASNVGLFLGALIVAGIMMAYGEGGSAAMLKILSRVVGTEYGLQVQRLSTMTTRSIAVGVLGVALIQALILGVGFFFAGVPAAGVLAVVVMVIGVLQLPALLISIPVIGYLWAATDYSNTHNIVWTIYLIVGGFSDNVLKPLLLGRGVEAPMPVILLGAIGGMVTSGIIGLFLGAVFLAVGYRIFMQWVESGPAATGDTDQIAETDGAG
jgi:predicted PurR-regulated permease PerM